jgi:hypothetical protein
MVARGYGSGTPRIEDASGRFQDLSFSEWLAHTPPEAVMAHLRIAKATYDAIPKDGGVVMPL